MVYGSSHGPSRLLLYLISHKWVQCGLWDLWEFLSGHHAGQILFCSDVSARCFSQDGRCYL